MSIRKLPDYRLKQKTLYIDKTPAATLIHYGDLLLEAGSLSDALEFYARAGHQTGLKKIKEIASENGDTFLFQGAARALGIELRPADWEDIARRAVELKKFSFAKKALEKTNNAELLNALTTKIKSEELKQSA
ncbi:MAG: putative cytosolic protein [Deltaproteobacteria bacterium]|nr:putative cytosolic protein [Deltaproteobacteria bacterium]